MADGETVSNIQQLVEESPFAFWDSVARRELHWLHSTLQAWLTRTGSAGGSSTGWHASSAAAVQMETEWSPWQTCDTTHAPYVRWFHGGLTNAAFNEIDRHVLQAGNSKAFISDAGDGTSENMMLRDLLIESTLVAHVLVEDFGLNSGQRVAFYLPNDLSAAMWIEAAKRIGAPYVAVAGGTSSPSLSSRLTDTGAAILVSKGSLVAAAQEARQLMDNPPAGILVPPDTQTLEGWALASAPLQLTRARLGADGLPIHAPPEPLVRSLWYLAAPLAVDACFPLFVLYTSGSTGKPKGIVHTHGGYQVGLCLTTQVVFNMQSAEDVFLVIATPGWITGQSYMLAASLLCRVPSVLLEGSPVSPPNRFAMTIERHSVSVLKAGSTFLRLLMTMPGGEAILQQHNLGTLRLGTFCAEPVNEAVHRFAMTHVTATYINSYWATEHGGIVWSRCHGHVDQPLQPDTRSWPLPWIAGEVLLRDELTETYRVAADGEQGEVVIRHRYPYQALTVWQSEGFGAPTWRGDLERWAKYFVPEVGYVQGDAAVRHPGGAFTFHGRSDEVINVGGNRIGTEEIESALLADTQRDGSPLRNVVVVGMPDNILGLVPCAFVTLQPGARLSTSDEGRLRALVQERLGPVAVPKKIIVASALPETYSGKFMRKLLQMMLSSTPLGDLGALKNPDCVQPLQLAVSLATAKPVTRGQNAQAMLATVTDVLRSLLAVEEVSTSEPLMNIGIDSLSSTHFVSELQQRTGLQLSPTLTFDYSTAGAVAEHLAELMRPSMAAESMSVHSGRSYTSDLKSLAGFSGRWPGGICRRPADAVWTASLTGVNAVGEVPAQRWTLDASIAPSHLGPYVSASRHFASIMDADLFDTGSFGMSSTEAASIDPQQRLLLEGSYETFKTAGLGRGDLSGTDAGVFLGITNADFNMLLASSTSVYAAVGGTISVAAGRISFALGLYGTCESIDTACSSAIAALHAAELCVDAADCKNALVTAVSLMLVPHVSIAYARAGMLSPDGRCRTFDAAANGYVRGEGVGHLVLGSSQLCQKAAELLSSAVRQDGTSASLTAPHGSAQITLIRIAIARASCDAQRCCAIEAHGTGTPLGDPTEGFAAALQPKPQSTIALVSPQY